MPQIISLKVPKATQTFCIKELLFPKFLILNQHEHYAKILKNSKNL